MSISHKRKLDLDLVFANRAFYWALHSETTEDREVLVKVSVQVEYEIEADNEDVSDSGPGKFLLKEGE